MSTRHPCERCGCRLYYHEQNQRWCRQCAAVLGIERLCDRGRTQAGRLPLAARVLQWARDRMEMSRRMGAPPDVLERWQTWITQAEDLLAAGALWDPSDPVMRDWIAAHLDDPMGPMP